MSWIFHCDHDHVCMQCFTNSLKGEGRERTDKGKIIVRGKKMVLTRNSRGCVQPSFDHWHARGNRLHSTGWPTVSRHSRAQRPTCASGRLALPTPGYSEPPCHYSGSHWATTDIQSNREKYETNCSSWGEGGGGRDELVVLLLSILFCHILGFCSVISRAAKTSRCWCHCWLLQPKVWRISLYVLVCFKAPALSYYNLSVAQIRHQWVLEE